MVMLALFRAKISKYGDRVLETIESTIKEYYKTDKNSSGNNDSTDTIKRRRDSVKVLDANANEDDDFTKSTDRSRGRAVKRHNKGSEVNNIRETEDYYNQCIDDDLDFDDSICEAAINESASKADRDGARRTLPSWSAPSNGGGDQHPNMFQEYFFKG